MKGPPLMLCLFHGRGGACRAMRERGWEVVCVDLDPAGNPTHVADVRSWTWTGRPPTLVWGSPPCQPYARHSMPWTRAKNPPEPDRSCWEAVGRIARETEATYYVIENVKGAARFHGPPTARIGPIYLWGELPPNFPEFKVKPFKEKLSGRDAASRSITPYPVSLALALYVEAAQ